MEIGNKDVCDSVLSQTSISETIQKRQIFNIDSAGIETRDHRDGDSRKSMCKPLDHGSRQNRYLFTNPQKKSYK